MNDGQALLERCLLLPADANARVALADWLGEHGDPELAEAVRGPRGEEYLLAAQGVAQRLARFPCIKLLWGVALVHVALDDHWRAQVGQLRGPEVALAPGQLLTVPEGVRAWPQRPGFFRRTFGR